MGFLHRILNSRLRDEQSPGRSSSFEELTEDELDAHLRIAKYGSFTLTDAVRPSYGLDVVPQAGYRRDVYRDRETGVNIPVLMISASRESLLDLFIDLLDPLGDAVDVVLETSHTRTNGSHTDLYRESIDLPVLKSTIYDFEDMLLNDGCTGIAVLNPRIPLEVQFDEHKLLIVYGSELLDFESVLVDYGLECSTDLRFITEAEHVHSSTEEFQEEFEQLRYRLGIED